MTTPRFGLLNPLPEALHHYAGELTAMLEEAGAQVLALPAVSIEKVDGGLARLHLMRRIFAERLAVQERRALDHTIVTWPSFGLVDPRLWRTQGQAQTSVVVHDPEPLRRQVGLGRGAALVASRGSRRGAEVLVHSQAARLVLESRGVRVDRVVPHPMHRPVPGWKPAGHITVLGQFKAARDVAILADMGKALRELGYRTVIHGRGWPPVAGWDVSSRFLTEEEFDTVVRSAACIIIPYRKVFQSGVAVRAAELGVPAAGPATSNIAALYGEDWPGNVPGDSSGFEWAERVHAAASTANGDLIDRARAAYEDTASAWMDWAADKGPK